MREELKLPTIRTENLKIKVFGNDKFKSEKADIALLIFVGNLSLVTIEAIFYPMICSELNNQDIFCAIENYEHLQGLSLADNTHYENKKIGLLIGMDYYYSCVSGAQIRGQPNEPIAPSSIFRWIFAVVMRNLNLLIPTSVTYYVKYRNLLF